LKSYLNLIANELILVINYIQGALRWIKCG